MRCMNQTFIKRPKVTFRLIASFQMLIYKKLRKELGYDFFLPKTFGLNLVSIFLTSVTRTTETQIFALNLNSLIFLVYFPTSCFQGQEL